MKDFWQLLGKVFSRKLDKKGAKPVAKKDKQSKKDRLTELEELVAAQAENIKNLTKEVSSLKRVEGPLLCGDAFRMAKAMGFVGTYEEFLAALKGE